MNRKTRTIVTTEWRARTSITVHVLGASTGTVFREYEFFAWHQLNKAADLVREARDFGYNVRVSVQTVWEHNEHYEMVNVYDPS